MRTTTPFRITVVILLGLAALDLLGSEPEEPGPVADRLVHDFMSISGQTTIALKSDGH